MYTFFSERAKKMRVILFSISWGLVWGSKEYLRNLIRQCIKSPFFTPLSLRILIFLCTVFFILHHSKQLLHCTYIQGAFWRISFIFSKGFFRSKKCCEDRNDKRGWGVVSVGDCLLSCMGSIARVIFTIPAKWIIYLGMMSHKSISLGKTRAKIWRFLRHSKIYDHIGLRIDGSQCERAFFTPLPSSHVSMTTRARFRIILKWFLDLDNPSGTVTAHSIDWNGLIAILSVSCRLSTRGEDAVWPSHPSLFFIRKVFFFFLNHLRLFFR